ncbi:MAG TPA: hypothetical protein EYH11_02275 [Sulfurimonas autotrophica]|nr:hypothetical protein [Sulfurimonas autotrophica]
MEKIIANTFTPLYDAVEDRILLIINYEDINNRVDFMITRSFLLKILPSMEEFMFRHYGLEESQSNTSSTAGTASTPKKSTPTDFANLELFAKEKELLQEVNFTYNEKNQQTILRLSSKKSSVVASLEYSMLESVKNAIKKAIPHFEWGFSINF